VEKDKYCRPSNLLPTYCSACVKKDVVCIFPPPTPVIGASEVDAEGDAKEAGASMAVATAGALTSMAGVEAAEETDGSVVEPSPMPEERAEGDHAEGVSRQREQFERELRVTSLDHASPAAEEAVARALGEDSDVQEVSGASATAAVVDPDAMEGVRMIAGETVPRQG